MKIIFVIPSKYSEQDFYEKAPIAKSLKPFQSKLLELMVYPNGNQNLSGVFNHAIENSGSDGGDIFVFCHDDFYILDFYWIDRLLEGLGKYDVVGIAGNSERISMQPSWLFKDINLNSFNVNTLSGIVAHGTSLPSQHLSIYGPPDQEVEILDGIFLGMTRATIDKHALSFDETFAYDFYDLDFCRLARSKNLKLGTIPISVMHESGGKFNTQQWRNSYLDYIKKWGD